MYQRVILNELMEYTQVRSILKLKFRKGPS